MPNNDYILRSDALKAILGVSIYDTIEELEGARTIAENTWADGLWDAYKIIEEEVDAADVEPKRRWIPVTDEPPEAGVIVWDGVNPPHEARMIGEIIIEDDGERQTKIYVDGEELTEYLTGDADEMPPRITHWTAMPEPPKEEEE